MLIAEIDLPLCQFLKDALELEGHNVDLSHRGDEAYKSIDEIEYEMFILALDLPGMDGLSLLKRARITRPSLPVLVLTARNEVEDRVQCLDAGADDYMTKPFSFLELSARVRALLRRSHLPSESLLTIGDLRLDRVQRRVERAGKRVDLTSKEFALLEYLMRNAGRRVTRDMIIEHVWNFELPSATTNVVDVYIMRKIVERSLRQAGVDLGAVAEASNGAEALTVLAENAVDLILCDINMPVMDGIEFVRQLQSVEQAKGIPVVMITTEGSESHVVQALSAGARGYIRKPFTAEQVKEHVLPVLGRKA
jgi:two-component system copper resistance phosphate regulon response regulator CusR